MYITPSVKSGVNYMVHDYSIILLKDKPEIRLTIPFKSSPKQANSVFASMAFTFNCSPYDKIYLFEHNYKGTRSVMLNLAYLKGSYL